MIARIEGKLLKLESDRCLLQVGGFGYEIMLPGYCVSMLSDKVGSEVTFCTMEYYEGTPAGGNLIPRMVGFLTHSEREFFTKYTTVKGMGIRKALKSLSIPISTIAGAVEAGDDKTLLSLPGVGKRMAQQIVAELKGKLASYAVGAETVTTTQAKLVPFQAEALEILIAWGEKRSEMMELIQLACQKHPDIKTAEDLVPMVYRIKQGVEV